MNQSSYPIKIAGIGRYLPQRVVPSSEVEALCGVPAGWAERRNGVRARRWADVETETNAYMAAAATREAVAQAGIRLDEIDLILNASGTPQQAIPDGSALLQEELGLSETGIPGFSIHATCLSFVAGLQTAVGWFHTHPACRYILLATADIASVGLNFDEPESATLLGDAAAAVVLARSGPDEAASIEAMHFETYSVGAHLTEIRGGGSHRHPTNPHTVPADNLFHMEGPQVLRLAHRRSRPFLDRLRPGLHESLLDVDWVVPHQASLMGVRLMRTFGWLEERIVMTLPELGNCVAASIPVTLYEVVHSGRLQRGQRVLLVGTGAGMSLGGVILTY